MILLNKPRDFPRVVERSRNSNISRKYRFSWIFRQKSRFLTYVNFSLSAKFNRFFIILGGSPWIYLIFGPGTKRLENRDFSWILAKIVDFIKWVDSGKKPQFLKSLFKLLNSTKIGFFTILVLRGDRVE